MSRQSGRVRKPTERSKFVDTVDEERPQKKKGPRASLPEEDEFFTQKRPTRASENSNPVDLDARIYTLPPPAEGTGRSKNYTSRRAHRGSGDKEPDGLNPEPLQQQSQPRQHLQRYPTNTQWDHVPVNACANLLSNSLSDASHRAQYGSSNRNSSQLQSQQSLRGDTDNSSFSSSRTSSQPQSQQNPRGDAENPSFSSSRNSRPQSQQSHEGDTENYSFSSSRTSLQPQSQQSLRGDTENTSFSSSRNSSQPQSQRSLQRDIDNTSFSSSRNSSQLQSHRATPEQQTPIYSPPHAPRRRHPHVVMSSRYSSQDSTSPSQFYRTVSKSPASPTGSSREQVAELDQRRAQRDVVTPDPKRRTHPPSSNSTRHRATDTMLDERGTTTIGKKRRDIEQSPPKQIRKARKLKASRGRPKATDYDSVVQEVLALAIKFYTGRLMKDGAYPDKIQELALAKASWDDASLSCGISVEHNTELISMIVTYTSHLRSEMKTNARTFVESVYNFENSSKLSVQERNRKLVEHLKSECNFVYKKIGETNSERSGIYQHKIIQMMANKIFFKDASDDGIILDDVYRPFPLKGIALILTAIQCAIEEWHTGSRTAITFSVHRYHQVYCDHVADLELFRDGTMDAGLLAKIQNKLSDTGRINAKVEPVVQTVRHHIASDAVTRALNDFSKCNRSLSEPEDVEEEE